jgi:hypothetical protein
MVEPSKGRLDRHIGWCTRHSIDVKFYENHKPGMLL